MIILDRLENRSLYIAIVNFINTSMPVQRGHNSLQIGFHCSRMGYEDRIHNWNVGTNIIR